MSGFDGFLYPEIREVERRSQDLASLFNEIAALAEKTADPEQKKELQSIAARGHARLRTGRTS